jgi:small subunit ribosomal protein S1
MLLSPESDPNNRPGTSVQEASASAPGEKKPEGLISAELSAEMDAAIKDMDAAHASSAAAATAAARAQKKDIHAVTPAGGPRPAALRGPRVVQAGREHRVGKIVSVGPTDIFIEFGPKELGVVQRIQWKPDEELPKVGEEFKVVVDKFEPGESLFMCSRPGSVQKADWELLEVGQTIEARVASAVKGGLELEVAGHRAFMPASQVSSDRVEDLSSFVGQKLTCKVARVDRAGRGNIVLSRRDLLDEERKEQAEKLKTTLQEGQTLEGTVRKIMPFGAFVDLGGIDGLVHISDLSYDRVGFGEKAVAKYVQEGQKVSVRILKVDIENNRISLGLKQVMGDPFANAAGEITAGADRTGRVTKIMEFGAFVEISPGVEGLVHISELDHRRVEKVDDVLKQDEVVTVRVLKIDPQTRRISLSLKALKPLPEVTFGGEGGQGGPGGHAGPGGPGGPGGGEGRGGPGRPGGGPGRPGGMGGGKGRREQGRSAEEILKETPALRRMREKFKNSNYKGGLG